MRLQLESRYHFTGAGGSKNNIENTDFKSKEKKGFRMLPRSVFDLKSRALYMLLVLMIVLSILYYLKCCSHWENVDDITSQAVVIDAGSTGSRLNLYTFSNKGKNQKELVKHVFLPIKPGLSSFAKEPEKGALSLAPLLRRANQEVPVWRRERTPLALWATAGLRLLPEEQSQALLHNVRKKLLSTEYKVDKNSVQIIDGAEEGFFAWMTVNFLLGSLHEDTVGTIDLGGGSVQITFEPRDVKNSFSGNATKYKKEATMFGQTKNIYVRSYLNLGLMAGRFQIMGGKPSEDDTRLLRCGCLPPKYTDTWSYGNKEFKIQQGKLPSGGDCMSTAQTLVRRLHRVPELKERRFVLMSYFFDRASELGLVDAKTGGIMQVGAFRDSAKKECSSQRKDRPFMCMDLVFISTLLMDGFGFPADKQIEVRNKINGVEANWGLGAAFQLLS